MAEIDNNLNENNQLIQNQNINYGNVNNANNPLSQPSNNNINQPFINNENNLYFNSNHYNQQNQGIIAPYTNNDIGYNQNINFNRPNNNNQIINREILNPQNNNNLNNNNQSDVYCFRCGMFISFCVSLGVCIGIFIYFLSNFHYENNE